VTRPPAAVSEERPLREIPPPLWLSLQRP